MTAVLFDIVARQKAIMFGLNKLSDFNLGPPRDVADDMAISSPDWTLYSLDIPENRAVFAEMPPGTDLSTPVFIHSLQFEKALRIITMSLDAMIALAAKVPPLPKLAILFNTGRCGSTLTSRILAQIPGVWSLSEPDYLTDIAFARRELDQARAKALIAAGTRLICRPPVGLRIDTVVIKPRSEPIAIAEWVVQALPQARYVFLYRDAEGFANSLHKFAQRAMGDYYFVPESWRAIYHFPSINGPLSLLDDYVGKAPADVLNYELHTMMWLLRIEGYLAALAQGVPFTPLHYLDLNTDRPAGTKALLRACGISEAHLDLALRGFEKDAHEGSGSDNAHPAKSLTENELAGVQAMLRRLGRPDYRDTRLPEQVGRPLPGP
jgi:hypothetical protein